MSIKDLDTLMAEMKPMLDDGEYVFVTVPEENLSQYVKEFKLAFREKEGLTLILEKDIADSMGFSYVTTWALITLNVYSNLEAIGFLSRITETLSSEKISANIVSAYYHDHVFVQHVSREKAVMILKKLSEESKQTKT